MRAGGIVRAGAPDVVELSALVNAAYRGASSRTGRTTEADLLLGQRTDEDEVRTILADPHSQLLVHRDEQGVLACCQLQDRGGGLAYFGMFAVRPGAQGAGIGRRMLAEAQRRAREGLGATALEMTIIAQRQELVAWYERQGFRRTGQTRPFPYGQVRAGIPQRDDLEFVVLRRELSEPRELSELSGTT